MDKKKRENVSIGALEQILRFTKKTVMILKATSWWIIRFFAVPATLAASVGAAYLCASSMEKFLSQLPVGAAVLGGGVVIATVKGLAQAVPSIFDFLERPSFKKLSMPTVAVFTASFGLFASYYIIYEDHIKPLRKPAVVLNLGDRATVQPVRPSISLTFMNQVPPLTPDGPAPITFYITFGEEATTDALDKGHGPGMDIDPSDKTLLKNLLASLHACCEDENQKVHLELVGFSSSSDWANSEDKISDKNNLQLSNARAKKVEDFLRNEAQSLSKDNWLIIDCPKWEKLSDMVRSRQFHDRLALGIYSDLRGRLNRRVEIRLIKAANCQNGYKRGTQ